MGDIIEIGTSKFERAPDITKCRHKYLAYDNNNEEVTCRDCNKVIPPFEAFMKIVFAYREAHEGLVRREKELEELEMRHEKGLLKATQRVDHAWRSKSMVPICPHCKEAIFPEDGFGSSMFNKKMALEARRFKDKNDKK